jgi:hypothetical protein
MFEMLELGCCFLIGLNFGAMALNITTFCTTTISKIELFTTFIVKTMNAIMLNVIKLDDIILNVIMLSVVAAEFGTLSDCKIECVNWI